MASWTKAFKVIVIVKIKLNNSLRFLLAGAALFCSAVHADVRPLDRVVAIVDNDVVMQSQLQRRLQEVHQTLLSRGAPLPPEHVLTQQVLERLIIENIQQQIAERSGVRISDEELNHAMATIAERNGLSLEQFQQALQKDGISYQDASEQVRREMIISRVRQLRVGERISVSEQEVRNFLASEQGRAALSEEYRLANILIPVPESAPSDVIQSAAQRAQDLYAQLSDGADFAQLAIASSADENALEGGEIGWRQAAQLPPPFDNLIRNLRVGQVTEPVRTPGGFVIIKLQEKRGQSQMLREEIHVRHILVKPSEIRTPEETQRLAERIYQRIQNGEDFAELARTASEDPGSALNGGDLGWISPDELVPEFRQIMDMTPQNDVTRPFQTRFGWHVLQVMGRRATDSSSQMREQQAMNILRNRKYDEELQTWLRQIRDEAYVETNL